MKIIINEKTYELTATKARMFRKAIELTENMDLDHLKTSDLDAMIDFMVAAFGNQFSRDDVYDGLEADKLMPTITDCISAVVSGVTEKLESKNV